MGASYRHCDAGSFGSEIIVVLSIVTVQVVPLAFWISFAGLAYTYLVYPLIIGVAARWAECRQGAASVCELDDTSQLPEITVLIAAYNAQNHLSDRIDNLLECDYPADRLRVLVASDGSTDATVAVVRHYPSDRVKVLEYTQRRGKAATLVDAIKTVSSPVVVFTDATTCYEKTSLRNLVRHFVDPQIGLVAGKPCMTNQDGQRAESLYWSLEMHARRCEASLGITLGASGAIYAVRRDWFVAPTKPIINDDLVFPMLLRLSRDCEVRLDENARAWVSTDGSLRTEFARRSRIGLGAMQCLPVLMGLCASHNRRHAFAFVSHKLLRWIGPIMLLIMLGCNLLLMHETPFQGFLLLQCMAYSAALVGQITHSKRGVFRVCRVATSFFMMNAALATGIVQWVRKPNTVIWNPTPRLVETSPLHRLDRQASTSEQSDATGPNSTRAA